jgi:bacillithiol system protein YtxJ
MGLFSSNKSTFPWVEITSIEQLKNLLDSESKYVIFKHSTRCSISSFAKRNFEKEFDLSLSIPCYYLDLIQYRDISNTIANELNVQHQSPQVFLIDNKQVVYHASHENIDGQKINSLI